MSDSKNPPPGVALTWVPGMDIYQAVDWYKQIGVEVTPRYLKEKSNTGELRCSIIAGRRAYSSNDLWDFITSRPCRKSTASRR